MLDVGCGLGHWSSVVLQWFPNIRTLSGIDIEPKWIERARASFQTVPGRASVDSQFVVGRATDLPFADETFDVVTCQTLLMHVPSPSEVLAEMLRVLKPGGVVVVSEPTNLRAFLEMDTAMPLLGLDGMLKRHRLWLACHVGRIRLGLGDFNVGDQLLPLLANAGAVDVEVVMNNKARPIAPPYDVEMLALIEYQNQWDERVQGADREATLRLAVAGGLSLEEAASLVAHEREWHRIRREQVAAGVFASGGASHQLVAWGRKSSPEVR